MTVYQEQAAVQSKTYIFVLLWLAGAFAGMDANLFSVFLPDVLQSLQIGVDQIGTMGSYILSAFLFGWMVGGLGMGLIADRYGRVTACILSILFYAGFTGLLALAENPMWLIFCRFFVGIGIGGIMLSISVLLTEHFADGARALAVGALITSYQLGVFLSGALAALAGDWRMAFFLGALPMLIAIVCYFTLDESPRWLQRSKGHSPGQSASFFDALPKREFIVGATAFGAFLIGYWAALSWVPTWIQGLDSSVSTGHEKKIATMVHGSMAVLGCCVAGLSVNYFGRIPVILVALLGTAAASAQMFLTTVEFTSLVYFKFGLIGFFIGIGQAALYIYLPELFATPIRARAVGLCLNSGRIITSIAVLFVGMLVTFFGTYEKALFSFSFIYLIGAIALLFGTETLHRKLS